LLHEAAFKIYQPGEVVFLEGSPAADLYVVRSGFLKVAITQGDRERVLQYYREGDVFGGTALFFGGTQPASVLANTRSEVLASPTARSASSRTTASGAAPAPRAVPTATSRCTTGPRGSNTRSSTCSRCSGSNATSGASPTSRCRRSTTASASR